MLIAEIIRTKRDGKKLACGLDALVMDVKSGGGAFMPTHSASKELVHAIVAPDGRITEPGGQS